MTVPVLAAMLALGSAAEGSIASWGYNLENQVTDTPAGVGYQAIAAGYQHSLALKADGSIVSWGSDANNQVASTPTGTGYQAIAGGGEP